jgi:hypothetical protein
MANQADLWGADPISVAQCTSIVHGKLMYEGKLVHAVISAKLGIDLIYEFGTYDLLARDIKGTRDAEGRWHGEMPARSDDQALAVRVVRHAPGRGAPPHDQRLCRHVAQGKQEPLGIVNAWQRQLRYMGAREWCRAYKPSLLLGIVADDEVDEYSLARDVGAVAPAGPQLPHAEFNDARPGQLIEGPSPRRRAAARPRPRRRPRPPPRRRSEATTCPTR